jgi:hypothetical protein
MYGQFMKSWEATKQKTLARGDLRNDSDGNFIGAVGILALAPDTTSEYLVGMSLW